MGEYGTLYLLITNFFSQKPVHFKKVVALASTIGMLSSADCADKVGLTMMVLSYIHVWLFNETCYLYDLISF